MSQELISKEGRIPVRKISLVDVKKYYVDINNGSDTNDGSEANPWQTLHYAVTTINQGTPGTYVLNVASGTYSVANGERDNVLWLMQDNVTIQGSGGDTTIAAGFGAVLWSQGIRIYSQNATVQNMGFSNFSSVGIMAYNSSPGILRNTVTASNIAIYAYATDSESSPLIQNNFV